MQSLIPIVFLAALMYLLLLRPQQQRVKQQRAMVSSLKVGDQVVTVGGLLGRIVSLDDESATVETTPGVVLRFRRSAIGSRTGLVDAAGDEGGIE
ncbi:MAG: preprotein translocase subunit YajC [Actinomycetota bacterium]|jgi:preprotein translocase subunit YajC|nr:preprotein translocase subunit YajC [Actinomycetota bacterium]